MLVTGYQQPCQDQPHPQSGPWSLPLVPQTQWPNLFECEKKHRQVLEICLVFAIIVQKYINSTAVYKARASRYLV